MSDQLKEKHKSYALSKIQKWVDEKKSKTIIIPEMKKAAWGKEFTRFANHLKQKESSGDWTITNKIGCMGWFQFQVTTLEKLGFYGITVAKFKANPEIFPPALQEAAFTALVRSNKIALKQYESYIGETIKGVLITSSGLLAAIHLGGIVGIQRFFSSDDNPTDKNGTSIKDYLAEFAGYTI